MRKLNRKWAQAKQGQETEKEGGKKVDANGGKKERVKLAQSQQRRTSPGYFIGIYLKKKTTYKDYYETGKNNDNTRGNNEKKKGEKKKDEKERD